MVFLAKKTTLAVRFSHSYQTVEVKSVKESRTTLTPMTFGCLNPAFRSSWTGASMYFLVKFFDESDIVISMVLEAPGRSPTLLITSMELRFVDTGPGAVLVCQGLERWLRG